MAFQKRKLFGIDKLIQSILQASLPSGFVGWFDRTTAPDGWVVCNGQTYTDSTGTTRTAPNLIGRYPLGATSGIGSTVEAGLPNITGGFSIDNKDPASNYIVTGSFTKTNPGIGTPTGHRVGEDKNAGYCFPIYLNARLSSTVYGNSSTVTPPSTKLLPCIKK